MLLTTFEPVASPDIAVVASKPHFFEIHGLFGLIHKEKRWFELESSLMDGHGVSDMSSRWICDGFVGRAIEGDLKLAYTVHTVEETKEVDSHIWSAECSPELLHIFLQLDVLRRGRVVPAGLLVIAEGFPGKVNHFFVAFGQKANVLDHLRKKSCCIGTAREPKDIDMIPREIIAHYELVSSQHMAPERCANCLVHGSDDAGLNLGPESQKVSSGTLAFDVGADSRC